MKRAILYKLTILLIAVHAQADIKAQSPDLNNEGLFYRISGNELEKPSFLFGTYHLINDGFIQKKPNIIQQLNESQQVIVETEIDSSKILMAGMKMIMKNDSISGYLNENEERKVSQFLESKLGMKLKQVDKMKPAAIMAMIAMAYVQEELGDELAEISGVPMDMWIAKEGHRQNKNVISLETMEEQLSLLYDGKGISEQVDDLLKFYDSADSAKIITRRIFESYKDENLKDLHAISKEEADIYGEIDYLTIDRNKKWMDIISKSIKKDQTFIAVGALHLPGEDGLIDLLRKEGYTVEEEPTVAE